MERTGQLTGVSTDPDFQYDDDPVMEQEEPDPEMDKAKGVLLKAALKRRQAKKKQQGPPPQASEQGICRCNLYIEPPCLDVAAAVLVYSTFLSASVFVDVYFQLVLLVRVLVSHVHHSSQSTVIGIPER